MEKTVYCKCKSGCNNKRCICLKYNEPCDDNCSCVDCKNPLNGVDIDNLSLCTIQHIRVYKELSKKELEKKYELPCECEEVSLKELLNNYNCSKCGELYWYSFCWNDVVQDDCTWHCGICGECRDWRVSKIGKVNQESMMYL